jgi:hypothetical protein
MREESSFQIIKPLALPLHRTYNRHERESVYKADNVKKAIGSATINPNTEVSGDVKSIVERMMPINEIEPRPLQIDVHAWFKTPFSNTKRKSPSRSTATSSGLRY